MTWLTHIAAGVLVRAVAWLLDAVLAFVAVVLAARQRAAKLRDGEKHHEQ